MYQNDEFSNKSNNLSSIAREHTCSHPINPSRYGISSDPNKFLPDFHSNYLPLHDLTSLNPTHALSPSNTSISSILCSDDQAIIKEDEEDEQEIRKIKRMISNRESARRSRLRKRKQLENLQNQVFQLLAANHQLADKLNQVMESNYQIVQENAQLRQEAAALQKNVTDLLISMKSLEEGGACSNGIRIRASQTITSASFTSASMDVLH